MAERTSDWKDMGLRERLIALERDFTNFQKASERDRNALHQEIGELKRQSSDRDGDTDKLREELIAMRAQAKYGMAIAGIVGAVVSAVITIVQPWIHMDR